MKKLIFIFSMALVAAGCSRDEKESDAWGNFEVTEITVSAEGSGRLLQLNVEEGTQLQADATVGQIDTVDIFLKREQLKAQRQSILSRNTNIASQVEVQRQQKENLLIEKARLEKLLENGAATAKQMDDIKGQIKTIEKQILSVETQGTSIASDVMAIDRQIDQLNESLRKCRVRNPIAGTVLTRYAEAGEVVTFGKALYKIADLNVMTLKVYVSGEQLPRVKIGQKVDVMVDKDGSSNRTLEGTVSWVSPTAEFTPKIIQTKEERVNLVYAVKILVKNDGTLKIGMPGEMKLK